MRITNEQSQELLGLLEDSVQYFCDENHLSGELAWTAVQCAAVAKLAELQVLITFKS